MPKQKRRGSLIGLNTAAPKAGRVETTPEMERLVMGAAESTYVLTDISTSLRKRSREPVVLMNAKLPASLHVRLKRTAQFNDVSMTEILMRAIEAELSSGRYAAPPEAWGPDLR